MTSFPDKSSEQNSIHQWIRGCFTKNSYKTIDQAETVARDALKKRGTRLRIYSCEHCTYYHLTKKNVPADVPLAIVKDHAQLKKEKIESEVYNRELEQKFISQLERLKKLLIKVKERGDIKINHHTIILLDDMADVLCEIHAEAK